MSYGLEYSPVAARAEPSARTAFIRKTYLHLAGAILIFTALETFLVNLPGVENFILVMFAGRFSWLIVLAAFMGASWLANSWAQSNTSRGLQYLGLSLYVVAEAVIFLPLIYIATNHFPADQHVIRTAGILTLAVFAGLTVAVFVTGRDYSYLRTYLTIGSFLALGFIIASLLTGFVGLGLIFCFFMVALASGYIVYQTSNIIHHYRTDQHVAASLALFASVALLFWYILQIVMSSRSR
jgi:FtsH-binding integral membrane protein